MGVSADAARAAATAGAATPTNRQVRTHKKSRFVASRLRAPDRQSATTRHEASGREPIAFRQAAPVACPRRA